MSENQESSVLEKWMPHVRKERYLEGEAIGVRDEDISARTPKPEHFDPVGDAIQKVANTISRVIRR